MEFLNTTTGKSFLTELIKGGFYFAYTGSTVAKGTFYLTLTHLKGGKGVFSATISG